MGGGGRVELVKSSVGRGLAELMAVVAAENVVLAGDWQEQRRVRGW